ncbi:Protein PET18 [Candida viswanathii]|uniref:Protein PET18 n=1 Tax=Candida viswanathii TaxID=5486 RepID=A0A367YK54_9ASCO|nr:Protein PET18 [Candida viswanathii]
MSVIERLLKENNDIFQESITHPLTTELCQGTLADYKLFTYLHQDLKYFQISLNLFGKTLAYCDFPKAAIRLGKQIGFISSLENDYFTITLKELTDSSDLSKVKKLKDDDLTLPAVTKYLELLHYLTYESTSYIELITLLYVMEKTYLGWAQYNTEKGIKEGLAYKHQEWINLHLGYDFEAWVDFLASEVERVVKTEDEFKVCEAMFVKTVKLETEFFEACYTYRE